MDSDFIIAENGDIIINNYIEPNNVQEYMEHFNQNYLNPVQDNEVDYYNNNILQVDLYSANEEQYMQDTEEIFNLLYITLLLGYSSDYEEFLNESFNFDKDKNNLIEKELLLEYKNYKNTNEENCTCNICLELFKDEDSFTKLDCGHMYHENCIKTWGKIKNNCPSCRRTILLKD